MAGIVVLRRSPCLKISNADAWSSVAFNPHTGQWCFGLTDGDGAIDYVDDASNTLNLFIAK